MEPSNWWLSKASSGKASRDGKNLLLISVACLSGLLCSHHFVPNLSYDFVCKFLSPLKFESI